MTLIPLHCCSFCGEQRVVHAYPCPEVPLAVEVPVHKRKNLSQRYKMLRAIPRGVWSACSACSKYIDNEHLNSLVARSLASQEPLPGRGQEKMRLTLLLSYRIFLEQHKGPMPVEKIAMSDDLRSLLGSVSRALRNGEEVDDMLQEGIDELLAKERGEDQPEDGESSSA